MNLSQQSSAIGTENSCKSFFSMTDSMANHSLRSFAGELLIAAAVLEIVSRPFTILLNALVMVAVKAKRRLQTHPNILLASLALADLMVGLVVHPIHITLTIFLLQGREFHEFCELLVAFAASFLIFNIASFFHLVLISGERFLAIKYTFIHETFVTKPRLIFASVLAWIGAVLTLALHGHAFSIIVSHFFMATMIFVIICFQIVVYRQASRHENQILENQVSPEAREKFRKDMKALKVTTTILAALIVAYFPPFVLRVVLLFAGDSISSDIKTAARCSLMTTVILNSLFNPVIYVVRVRQFRVAFIELLLRKTFQEAEEFEKRLSALFCGSSSEVVRFNVGLEEREERELNTEERNPSNHENTPQIFSPNANFEGNVNTLQGLETIPTNIPSASANTSYEETQHQEDQEETENSKTEEYIVNESSVDVISTDIISSNNGPRIESSIETTVEPEYIETAL